MEVTKTDFEVCITPRAWDKIEGWRNAASPKECGGISLVHRKGNKFVIYDSFLPKQICNNGHVELDKNSLGELDFKLHQRGTPQDHKRVFWHTHPTFNTFWSGEDSDTVERLARIAKGFYISIVTNNKNEYLCRLDMYEPFPITIDGIEMKFIDGAKARYTDWKFQVERAMIEPPPVKHIWADNRVFQGYQDWRSYDWNQRFEDVMPTTDYSNKDYWWNKEKEDKTPIQQLDLPNTDVPPIVREPEILTPKWYEGWQKRQNERLERAKAAQKAQEPSENGGIWVNHGGRMMKMEDYLREVRSHGRE